MCSWRGDNNLDPSAMALAFCAARPFMTSVIMGTTSVEQVKTDIAAGELTLSSDVMRGIEAIFKQMPDPQA